MLSNREPLPPIAEAVTPIQWVIVLGAWLALDLMAIEPLGQDLLRQGVVAYSARSRLRWLADAP